MDKKLDYAQAQYSLILAYKTQNWIFVHNGIPYRHTFQKTISVNQACAHRHVPAWPSLLKFCMEGE